MGWENARLLEWLGDLHDIPYLTEHLIGVISIAVSGCCGAIVGLEREKRRKPAGLRTLILISMGSTIFTMASLLIAGETADPGRVAAQVVTGIGFLGAGAIIHDRGSVVGLTTGATIWTVAAIGVVVGIGFAAAGLVLAFLIFLILTVLRFWERRFVGRCEKVSIRVHFHSNNGKTRPRLIGILDKHRISASVYRFGKPVEGTREKPGLEWVEIRYCTRHPTHRAFLPEFASMAEVESVEDLGRSSADS